MKLPSFVAKCFGGCARPPSESEMSVKAPGPSGTVVGIFLSSFMSRRSCSRGTWDYMATDAQKPRNRARGDADVVTLATARYLELFATTPRNDETSTVLSDVRETQNSLRSARTASENQVSRSSTFTGRASREPSRLGAGLNAQQPSSLASLPASSSQRFPHPPASFHRRGASDTATSISPGRDGATPQGPPVPHYGRKTGSAPHVTSLSPFTNKTRVPSLAASRCRSDRISPSTAAYLLPAPSVKAIARAHTAIPATVIGSGGMMISASLNDLSVVPGDAASSGDVGGATTAARSRDYPSISATYVSHAPAAVTAVDGKPVGVAATVGGGGGRRSRLQTESGGTALSEGSTAAQQLVPGSQQLSRSSTAMRGGANGTPRSMLPRRPSILFSRDGEVTVTGLPPSCLTAGRAPRCRADGPSCTAPSAAADVSAPILCSALYAANGSVDSTSSRAAGALRTGRQMSGAHESNSSALLFTSQDPGSRYGGGCGSAPTASAAADALNISTAEIGVSVTQIRIQQQRHGLEEDCGGTSASRSAKAVFVSNEVTPREVSIQDRSCSLPLEELLEADHHPQEQRLQQDQQEAQQQEQDGKVGEESDQLRQMDKRSRPGPSPGPNPSSSPSPSPGPAPNAGRRLERVRTDGSQVLALANSSSEGQRCDWGTSSALAPSRFSDSSRLTPATASVHSNNPLEKYPVVSTSPATAAAATPAGQIGTHGPLAGAFQLPPSAQAPRAALVTAEAAEGDQGVGSPVGTLPTTGYGSPLAASLGQSLLVTEARDVTSALNRLQEACMAAVAGTDIRSSRLCRRMSTDLPRMRVEAPPPLPLYVVGGGGAAAAEGGNGMGSLRATASVGGQAAMRAGGVRAGPARSASMSSSRSAAQNAFAPPPMGQHQNGGATAGAPALFGTASAQVTTKPQRTSPSEAGARGSAGHEAWDAGPSERASGQRGGLVMDGEVLRRVNCSIGDGDGNCDGDAPHPAAAEGLRSPKAHDNRSTDPAYMFEDPGDERQRNRMLNVLLRSEFLHETHASMSDEEDDGVLEYRYGGFELGGGDHDCGFARQASFMEAVRRCGTTKAASTAVGLHSSHATLGLTAQSRRGPSGTPLQRKGSCLAVAATASSTLS